MLTQYCNSKSRGRRYRYRLWRREQKLMWRWHVWELVLNGLPNQIISGQNQVFKVNLFIIQNKLAGTRFMTEIFLCEFKSEHRVKGQYKCFVRVGGISIFMFLVFPATNHFRTEVVRILYLTFLFLFKSQGPVLVFSCSELRIVIFCVEHPSLKTERKTLF